jgi:DNA mismatch endonuclease (patch repair protein)
MQAQRSWDTKPELALRAAVHRLGLRYFVHRRPLRELRREADLIFPKARVAVFLDSCFWHGCPEHASWPKANAEWWREKIERNRGRDRDTDARLRDAGWLPIRVWEHDDPDEAAVRIAQVVRGRS